MKYLVIGLGNLGRAIAEDLTRIGNEVVGVDKDINRVDAIKQIVSGAVALDTTDEAALGTLPLSEMDAVIVTYGKDLSVSVQTVALLKSLSVNKLIVRHISPIHETIIRAIGVNDIITPEQDFSTMYASLSLLGGLFKDWYKVTDTHHLYKIKTPASLVGQSLRTIQLENNFGVQLVAIEHPTETRNLIGLKQLEYKVVDHPTDDFILNTNDLLIIFGKMEVLHKIANI